ncbi:unnamed protein product [Symbiodinium natans]|uniref:G domain-containing protein n=1 Tax=Symbiodinium natans TaxID=878477 RepID=A0A812IHF0_9DINO|nr:unnamed protein product [Symbiodinium natans]
MAVKQRRPRWVWILLAGLGLVSFDVFLASATCGFALVRQEVQDPPGFDGVRPTNFLMIGNPGTGKSTVLNGLIQKPYFKSGMSFGGGMTYEFDRAEIGKHTFLDTPGLSDPTRRKQAAEAITEALKQNGYYKIFFVITLQNGRVRSEDVTTMKLVLDASPSNKYGVIINQLNSREYEALHDPEGEARKSVLTALLGTMPVDKLSPYIHLVQHDDDLAGVDNMAKPLPDDLRDFILKTCPGIDIAEVEVADIKASEYEALTSQMEEMLADSEKLKDALRSREAELKDLTEELKAANGNDPDQGFAFLSMAALLTLLLL